MNQIEQTYYDAFIEESVNPEHNLQCSQEIQEQVVVGIYVADFVINNKFIVEIDGHEYHKTKDQRYDDYRRERYLIGMGYIVLRFMGSEVFVSPNLCASETLRIINDITLLQLDEAYQTYRKIAEGDAHP